MNCAISGEVPVEPVVSKKTGLLYEKRLIDTHISDYGKCPVTGEPHTINDIVAIKTGKIVKPKPLHTASIPGLLGAFQTESLAPIPAKKTGTESSRIEQQPHEFVDVAEVVEPAAKPKEGPS